MGDWPEIRNFPEYAPYSAQGLIPPSDESSPYALPEYSQPAESGEIETLLPFAFGSGKSCVCIGSSRQYADVVVSNSEPLHAALLLNRRTRTWWLFACANAAETLVNGERIRLKELQDGDRIEIAGAKLAFRGDRLERWCANCGGMSISVRGMTFAVSGRPRPILDHVSFEVAPGEFVGVLGPSGCGKSSLVQRLVGLSDDYDGEVLVNGVRRETVEDKFRKATAYLPQNVELSLHDTLTLEDELRYFRALHVLPSEDDERENADCLAALGLSGKGKSVISCLSGGEKRRVGIALALLRKPQFLLLDEPGAGLDPATETSMMRYLRGIADQGRTVFCVTHELTNIGLCDKILVLAGGHVVYFGSPKTVLEEFHVKDFASLYDLLGAGNVPVCKEDQVAGVPAGRFIEAKSPSWLQVFAGYLRRSFMSAFALSSRKAHDNRLWLFLKSSSCLRLVWQPILLVSVIRLACAYYFQSDNAGKTMYDIEMLGFCSSLAVFWIGMNNTVREFVHEREPGRCLERLNGVSFSSYLASKMSYALAMGGLQTISFTLAMWILGRVPMPLIETHGSNLATVLPVSVWWLIPLSVSGCIGVLCGLCVSAMAKRELSAVAIVPNVAIMALLFSNQIVRFEGGSGGGYMRLAKFMAVVLMPCHWSAKVIVDYQCAADLFGDFRFMILQLIGYALFTSLLVRYYQNRNERAWDGR